MSHKIFLALGTNLGDRLANLQAAISALPPVIRVTAQSPVYQTKPWGFADQPDFLNQVIMGQTDNSPEALLSYLKALETRLGRTASFRNGPRMIDLDILFYDDLVLDQPGLSIPHPRLHERAFVLVPLADLAPDFRHPVLGETVRELLQKCDLNGIKKFVDENLAPKS